MDTGDIDGTDHVPAATSLRDQPAVENHRDNSPKLTLAVADPVVTQRNAAASTGTKNPQTNSAKSLQTMKQNAVSTLKNLRSMAQQKLNRSHGQAIFARPLEEVPADKDGIPFAMKHICEYLILNHLGLEGIFRVPGSTKEVQEMRNLMDQGKFVDFSDLQIVKTSHSIAALLKAFLRELPEPLFTTEYYDCFIASSSIADHEARMACIKKCIKFLPQRNQNIVFYLMTFLHTVAQKADENKMSHANLAIVFAPNLLRPKMKDFNAFAMGDTPAATKVIDAMIDHYSDIFNDAELVILETEEEQCQPESGTSPGRRSSMPVETIETPLDISTPVQTQSNLSRSFHEKQTQLMGNFKKFNSRIREQVQQLKNQNDQKPKVVEEIMVIESPYTSQLNVSNRNSVHAGGSNNNRLRGPRPHSFQATSDDSMIGSDGSIK